MDRQTVTLSEFHNHAVVIPASLQPLRSNEPSSVSSSYGPYKVEATRRSWYVAAILPDIIYDRRNGLMRGRLGFDHAMDIETAAFALDVQGALAPAVLFIDMEAAFPSVSHRFLFKRLQWLAGDHPIVRIIIDLHSEASTTPLVSGEEFPGFPCDAGVRQGCPLFGSLFVIVLHTFMVEIDSQVALVIFKCSFAFRLFAFAGDLAN